jgi:hypothetical protein
VLCRVREWLGNEVYRVFVAEREVARSSDEGDMISFLLPTVLLHRSKRK